MADTNHSHVGTGPVEGDGISYRGIVWFVVIMAVTVLGSQALMVGAFKWFEHQVAAGDAPRAPLARPRGELPPQPNLMYEKSGSPQLNERGNLEAFRKQEDAILNGYAYDPATGRARIPIDKAKDLLLAHGLPVRTATPPAAAAEAPAPAAAKK
jgi:hypothetical protein